MSSALGHGSVILTAELRIEQRWGFFSAFSTDLITFLLVSSRTEVAQSSPFIAAV